MSLSRFSIFLNYETSQYGPGSPEEEVDDNECDAPSRQRHSRGGRRSQCFVMPTASSMGSMGKGK